MESVSPREVRNAETTGYTLALSWSPQFCRSRQGQPRHATQCGTGASFGFILHGLWPDGSGRDDPAWCKPAAILSPEIVKRTFCITPSPQLQQHEWAKHGTCMAGDPATYFAKASALFNTIEVPDMEALSREGASVSALIEGFTSLNPALDADAIAIDMGPGGWLEEVKFCYDTNFNSSPCPRGMRQPRRETTVKIWRTVK
jgi:ribonuclease T2